MKCFSPAGMAVKGFYGGPGWNGPYSLRDGGSAAAGGRSGWVGPKTFGNPDGALGGGGAYGKGGASQNGPNQGGGGVSGLLNVSIGQDFIAPQSGEHVGVFLSDLLTPQQQTDWQNGVYDTLNISGSGSPPRGYWVIAAWSGGDPRAGFDFNLNPGIDVTINIDSSLLRFYGNPGQSGFGANEGSTRGFDGGPAFLLDGFANVFTINITNTVGANSGRFMGGGGGGGGGATGGGGTIPVPGGGGAGGWFAGLSQPTSGNPGTDGGIYDPANGGTGDPNVAGGSSGAGSTGNGGALGQPGSDGNIGFGGAAGQAIARSGTPGVTTILTGNDPAFIRGAVE